MTSVPGQYKLFSTVQNMLSATPTSYFDTQSVTIAVVEPFANLTFEYLGHYYFKYTDMSTYGINQYDDVCGYRMIWSDMPNHNLITLSMGQGEQLEKNMLKIDLM